MSLLSFGGGPAPQKAKLDMYLGAVAVPSFSTTGTSEQTHFKGEKKKTLNFNENKPVIKEAHQLEAQWQLTGTFSSC